MSTGYGWEGIRKVCATLLGARHVPERLCGGSVYLGALLQVLDLYLYLLPHAQSQPIDGHSRRDVTNVPAFMTSQAVIYAPKLLRSNSNFFRGKYIRGYTQKQKRRV